MTKLVPNIGITSDGVEELLTHLKANRVFSLNNTQYTANYNRIALQVVRPELQPTKSNSTRLKLRLSDTKVLQKAFLVDSAAKVFIDNNIPDLSIVTIVHASLVGDEIIISEIDINDAQIHYIIGSPVDYERYIREKEYEAEYNVDHMEDERIKLAAEISYQPVSSDYNIQTAGVNKYINQSRLHEFTSFDMLEVCHSFNVRVKIIQRKDFTNKDGSSSIYIIAQDFSGAHDVTKRKYIQVKLKGNAASKYNYIETGKYYVMSDGVIKASEDQNTAKRMNGFTLEFVFIEFDSDQANIEEFTNLEELREITSNPLTVQPNEDFDKIISIQKKEQGSYITTAGVVMSVDAPGSKPRRIAIRDDSCVGGEYGLSNVFCLIWYNGDSYKISVDDILIIKDGHVNVYRGYKQILIKETTYVDVVTPEHESSYHKNEYIHDLILWRQNKTSCTLVHVGKDQYANGNTTNLAYVVERATGFTSSSTKEYYTVKCAIRNIKNKKGIIFYPACMTCGKKVNESDKVYNCTHCKKETDSAIYKYLLNIELDDGKEIVPATIFNDVGEKLLGMSAASFKEQKQQNEQNINSILNKLIKQEFVFKLAPQSDPYYTYKLNVVSVS